MQLMKRRDLLRRGRGSRTTMHDEGFTKPMIDSPFEPAL
jgi:hypothetical protein